MIKQWMPTSELISKGLPVYDSSWRYPLSNWGCKDGVSEYHFQLKILSQEKMQSYIIYGNEGDIPIWGLGGSLCYL